jgi:hypothetical protein
VSVSLIAPEADPRMCESGRKLHDAVSRALDREVGKRRR